MAERRRRKQIGKNEENLSEGESQQVDDLSLSESDHGSENEYVDLSEYDSADDEYLEEDKKKEESVENDGIGLYDEDNDQHSEEILEAVSESDKEEVDDGTRESGDGKSDNDQESKIHNKVLKISEDRNSPFFIPTKGNFYQHDVRSDISRGSRGRGSRNIKSDFSKERWVHDKYNEDEQAPKTRDELIEEYGYDIRERANGKSVLRNSYSRGKRQARGRHGMSRPLSNPHRSDRYEESLKRRIHFESQGPKQSSSIRSRNFHATRSFSNENKSAGQYKEHKEARNFVQNNLTKAQEKDPNLKDTSKSLDTNQNEPVNLAFKDRTSNFLGEMNGVLSVINTKEQEDASTRKKLKNRNFIQERSPDKFDPSISERLKNISINKESAPPKRYSSQRQRIGDPPSNPSYSRHSANPPRRSKQHMPKNWTKQENDNTSLTIPINQSEVAGSSVHENFIQYKHEEVGHEVAHPNLQFPPPMPGPSELASVLQPSMTMAPPPTALPKFDTSSNDAATIAQLQWYEAALAYQQVLSQSLLNPSSLLQQHNSPHNPNTHVIGDGPLLLNNDQQTNSPPQIQQISHALGQGDMAGISFPPVAHEFQTSNFMQRGMLPERNVIPASMQVTIPTAPNLIGQQVGGVTYYPNALPPVQNIVPRSSPIPSSPMRRLNAAIPIKHPLE